MHIGVLGINHKSADLGLRESVARACQKLYPRGNTVLLSTCNRTEIYFSDPDLVSFHGEALHALQAEISGSFEHALYAYFGRDCFFHLACVTAGLDSVVLAESDIQRQVKVAYAQAASLQKLPSALHFLFQKCLKIGKRARSYAPLFKMSLSLEQIIYQLIGNLFVEASSVLFVGNSEVNRKIIRLFVRRGLRKISLATRTPHAAESFALDHGISLGDTGLIEKWGEFDVVISGTNHGDYVIRPAVRSSEFSSASFSPQRVARSCKLFEFAAISATLLGQKTSPPRFTEPNGAPYIKNVSGVLQTRLILDLSVPRSIDPALNRHPSLTLLNMEQLGRFAEGTRQNQWREVLETKAQISEAVARTVASYEKKVSPYAYC